MSRPQSAVLLFSAFLLGSSLISAQPRLRISQVDGSGQVTQSSFDPVTGPVAKAPAAAGKYWDGLSSTDSAGQAAYISAPPNPQIAAGPDDILTVVNRTIARYPNP